MVATGMLMLFVSWLAAYRFWRHGSADDLPKWLLRGLVAMTFSGWIATLAGWYTTEIGRQPWLVSGVMTTYDAVADIPAPYVAGTLTAYLTVYVVLLIAYIVTLFGLATRAARGEIVTDMPRAGGRSAAIGVTKSVTPAE